MERVKGFEPRGNAALSFEREGPKPFILSMVGNLQMERVKGFEPSASTLARLRSTPELHPRRIWMGDLYRS